MSASTNDKVKVQRFLAAMEASILRAPDEEVLEDASGAEKQRDQAAARVDELLRTEIKGWRQHNLRAAQEKYRAARAAKPRSAHIPGDPEHRRALLTKLVASSSALPKGLTMAFRDGKGLSDDDVKSVLEDLADFGFLDDDNAGQS
jgi:hypothetical protein